MDPSGGPGKALSLYKRGFYLGWFLPEAAFPCFADFYLNRVFPSTAPQTGDRGLLLALDWQQ